MRTLLLKNRRWIAESLHLGIAAVALPLAFLLRFDFTLDAPYPRMLAESLPLLVIVKLLVFRAFALRDLAWRYLGFSDLLRMATANVAAAAAATLVLRPVIGSTFPRSIHVLDLLVCFTGMAALRAAARASLTRDPAREETARASAKRRVLIYGAGAAGIRVLTELRANPQIGCIAAGFLDDDREKRRLRIHGLSVLGGGAELAAIAAQQRADEVWIALPRATGREISAILERCHQAGLAAKRVPALAELIATKTLAAQIREVRVEDLLSREPVRLCEQSIRERLAGRVALVTGAGGSIGSELCRQIARFRPRAIVGIDMGETALYQIDLELREQFPGVEFLPEIANVQNRRRLDEILQEHRPHAVFHAAAYKHVPMMESHLFGGIL